MLPPGRTTRTHRGTYTMPGHCLLPAHSSASSTSYPWLLPGGGFLEEMSLFRSPRQGGPLDKSNHQHWVNAPGMCYIGILVPTLGTAASHMSLGNSCPDAEKSSRFGRPQQGMLCKSVLCKSHLRRSHAYLCSSIKRKRTPSFPPSSLVQLQTGDKEGRRE